MKQILPLILACLLLCGCGNRPLPEVAPPPTTGPAEAAVPLEEHGGRVEKTPLDLDTVQGLLVFQDGLLLFSGTEQTRLTLVDPETLEPRAVKELDHPLEADTVRLRPEGTLCYYDPIRRETLELDGALRVLRRIETPGAVTAPPVLSGNTLYYCTPTHLRAWDLDTGIRRCLREMAFGDQTLTDVLMEGTVLQCRVTEAGRERTLFFSAEDGTLLHSWEGACRLWTLGSRYWGLLPAGANRLCLFGSAGAEPQLLTPQDPEADCFFLPEAELLLTAGNGADRQLQLCLYDLTDGSRMDRLALDPGHRLKAARYLGGALYLLTYDPALDRDVLLTWYPGNGGEGCFRSPYRDRDLTALLRQAEALGNAYDIRILIGPEAGDAAPSGFRFEPEPLPVLLSRELDLLEQRLKAYPKTVLAQTAGHFSSLTICILRSIRDSGPEDLPELQFLQGTDACLAIAAGSATGQNLYHGLFHLMETHIFGGSKALDQWDDLNPAGFRYDYDYAANAGRDSGIYLFQDHRAFVDTYSMSFPREDRARIMEYAMLPGQASLFRTEAMQNKLRTLCTGIREAYGLEEAEGPFLWEQYLD